MKTPLTKESIVESRLESVDKTYNAIKNYPSSSFDKLLAITGLDYIRLIQASVSIWALGGLSWIDPKIKSEKAPKNVKSMDKHEQQLEKWATASKDEFENDAEYLFETIDLFPGSTFKELRVLTGLDEHNLCVAIMWLSENSRIEINDESGAFNDESEMYFPAGIFDKCAA